MSKLAGLAERAIAGTASFSDLTDLALANIIDPHGQGGVALRVIWPELASATAAHQDLLRDRSIYVSPVAGLPISIKDNIDISGEVTVAGARACIDDPVRPRDAVSVARLRRAGAVLVGRANMSEFAFSGIGINASFGTPLNPWDRDNRRIAGGSSSGSAVSVSDGMAVASLATDTGGSVRAPAALCGLVGFKASRAWSPLEGVYPRAFALDSLGVIAQSVVMAARFAAVIADAPPVFERVVPDSRLRLAMPDDEVMEDLDPKVQQDFQRVLARLSDLGFALERLPRGLFGELRPLQSPGFTPPESAAIHRQKLDTLGDRFDPILRRRIERGISFDVRDYIDLQRARPHAIARLLDVLTGLDAIVLPTTPAIAPRIDQLRSADAFEQWSARILRNCGIANFLDLPAISLPMHDTGSAPTGLMLVGTGSDAALLNIGARVEAILSSLRGSP